MTRDLPPGWKWVLWVLGAGLSAAPAVGSWIDHGQVSEAAVWGSVTVAGLLFAVYAYVVGMARLGIGPVVSIFSLVVLGLVAGLMIPPLHLRSKDVSHKTVAINHMKEVGLALRLYEDRTGQFPPYDGDRFLAALYVSGDCTDLRCFTPKGAAAPVGSTLKAGLPGCIPGMAAYRNAAGGLKEDWTNPSVCAIACDTMPDGSGPYGGGHTRVVLYQDGSASARSDLTIGSANGDPGGPKDLSMLQMD